MYRKFAAFGVRGAWLPRFNATRLHDEFPDLRQFDFEPQIQCPCFVLPGNDHDAEYMQKIPFALVG
jgi:hypothetical protein